MENLIPALAIIAFLLSGCVHNTSREYSTYEVYNLSSQERARVISEALAGNAAAAVRMGAYHFFITSDLHESMRWYELAERNGDSASRKTIQKLKDLMEDEKR